MDEAQIIGRWLVARNCLPRMPDGFAIVRRGVRINLRLLCASLGPLPQTEARGSELLDVLWNERPPGDAKYAERFLNLVEWLASEIPSAAGELLDGGVELAPAVHLQLVATLCEKGRDDCDAMVQRALLRWVAKATPPPNAEIVLTSSQHAAFVRLLELARAYFAQLGTAAIKPRFSSLVIGPTGVGKSHLIRTVAHEVGAAFIRVSAGEWLPQGARDCRSTVFRILDELHASQRVIVMIDEVDKLSGETGTSWSRSVLNELYATLDRELPIREYLQHANAPAPLAADLAARVTNGLHFVAAGTWQSAWKRSDAVGFHGHSESAAQRVLGRINEGAVVPSEFVARFAWPPVILEYPNARETRALFDRFGITAIAGAVGVQLDPDSHDWRHGGMRTLETLVADLLLRLGRGELAPPVGSHSQDPQFCTHPDLCTSSNSR